MLPRISAIALVLMIALLAAQASRSAAVTELIDSTGDGQGHPLDGPFGIASNAAGWTFIAGGYSDNLFEIAPGGAIAQRIDGTGDGMGNLLGEPPSVATDSSGNLYVAGGSTDNVFKIDPLGVITEIIDASGDGMGNPLNAPQQLAVDSSGNLYVAGYLSNNVFRIAPGGSISEVIDHSGDGAGNILVNPTGVTTDSVGNLYVAGYTSDNVFLVTPNGVITELIDYTGNGSTEFHYPRDVAVDASGNVYVPGYVHSNVFRITPDGTITEIVDFHGDGAGNFLLGPWGIDVDLSGNVYVSGYDSDNLFRISPGGSITELADAMGDGAGNPLDGPTYLEVVQDGAIHVTGSRSDNAFRIDDIPYVAEAPPQSVFFPPIAADEGQSQGGQLPDSPPSTVDGLVFITHGWLPSGESSAWIDEMASEIAARLQEQGVDDEWDVVPYHWTSAATHRFPAPAARRASEIGQRVGEFYANLAGYSRYHLIGHSAGSWLIEAIADRVQGPGVTIHTTFLDSYVDWRHAPSHLGDTSTWSEQYVDGFAAPDPSQPFWVDRTDNHLDYAYNLVLTGLSSSIDPVERHAFPWNWYLASTKAPDSPASAGWGFARSQEMGSLPTHGGVSLSRGEHEELGTQSMRVVNYVRTASFMGAFLFDLAQGVASWVTTSNPLSPTLRIRTQSPAWVVSNVASPQPFNAIQFETRFVGSAQGWLSVRFAGEEVLRRDERYAPTGAESHTIVLSETFPAGAYPISFRVDTFFNPTDSEVEISNLSFATIESATEVPVSSTGSRFILFAGMIAIASRALMRLTLPDGRKKRAGHLRLRN